MRRFLFLAMLAFLFSCALPAQVGRRAPGFALPDVKGNEHDLGDHRGKIVIVDIMRTDCPHCAPFAKVLEQVKAYYAGKVEVLAITNPPDDQSTVARFVERMKITFPILFDCGQVAYSYILPDPLHGNAIAIPHTYLIDGNGFIRGDWEYGDATKDVFQGRGLYVAIDKLLAGRAH